MQAPGPRERVKYSVLLPGAFSLLECGTTRPLHAAAYPSRPASPCDRCNRGPVTRRPKVAIASGVSFRAEVVKFRAESSLVCLRGGWDLRDIFGRRRDFTFGRRPSVFTHWSIASSGSSLCADTCCDGAQEGGFHWQVSDSKDSVGSLASYARPARPSPLGSGEASVRNRQSFTERQRLRFVERSMSAVSSKLGPDINKERLELDNVARVLRSS